MSLFHLFVDLGGQGFLGCPVEPLRGDGLAEYNRYGGHPDKGPVVLVNIVRVDKGYRNNGDTGDKRALEAAFMEGEETVYVAAGPFRINAVRMAGIKLCFDLLSHGDAGAQTLSVQKGAADKFHPGAQKRDLFPLSLGNCAADTADILVLQEDIKIATVISNQIYKEKVLLQKQIKQYKVCSAIYAA